MDERIFRFKKGSPIPEWDEIHRLSIDNPVGPDIKSDSTIFRINSTFMDVSEQPYLERQLLASAVLLCLFLAANSTLMSILFIKDYFSKGPEDFISPFIILLLIIGTAFGFAAFKIGRDELFSLTRRPIRFNRKEKRIYAIRRRRFFCKPGEGDIVWEAPWNQDTVFCIHKGPTDEGHPYHIRCYILDKNNMVSRAFAIGRQWDHNSGVEDLLAQWNYWCWYMNHGPEKLPRPPLYLPESESAFESYLMAHYQFGFDESALGHILFMPIALFCAGVRWLSLSTCRAPVWPASVEHVSDIAPGDSFDEPSGNTPIGWAQTVIARRNQTYPRDPQCKAEGWRGEPDGEENARLWAEPFPPRIPDSRYRLPA